MGVLIDHEDFAVAVGEAEQDDGVMGKAIVQSSEPTSGAAIGDVVTHMDLAAEVGEELARGDVPVALAPGAFLPAGEAGEHILVIGIGEAVVFEGCRNEAGFGFPALLKEVDVGGAVPGVADAAGIGSGVKAGTPGTTVGRRFGGTAAGDDVMIFAGREGGGFLDTNDVVFEAEVGVDVLFALEMAGDDAGAIFEGEQAAAGSEFMGQAEEEAAAEVLEVLEVGFADFAEEEAFEAGPALAIIGAQLGEEPMGFAAAARAAETDGGGADGLIAEAGGGAGRELAGLENDAGPSKVFRLIERTAGALGGQGELVGRRRGKC